MVKDDVGMMILHPTFLSGLDQQSIAAYRIQWMVLMVEQLHMVMWKFSKHRLAVYRIQ
jgi:hypothetical protein